LAFRNLESHGNPWGISDRLKWMEGLTVPRVEEKTDFEYLFWVGCAGAFDEHGQKTSQAMIKLLNAAGVNYAVMGEAETCTGDAARRLGNEYLFQTLARQNIENFERLGVRKIITQCAHCFNSLKNEYPQLGGNYQVVSHVELIAELLAQGRLKLAKPANLKLTFHDACYLGRHNGIYQAPRQIIQVLQMDFKEAARHAKNALCCGAGGGRMWLEEAPNQRVNSLRITELLELNPQIIATACPFCTTMLSDGLKEKTATTLCADLAVLVADQLE
jgi:Fe-S oxidoreductase